MDFDINKANEMIGRYVLVGITHKDSDNNILSEEEVHGKVLRVDQDDGVVIILENGNEFSLPPLLDTYQKADEGIYKLKTTNEEIKNPDYIATFYVSPTRNDD